MSTIQKVQVRYPAPPQAGPGAVEAVAYLRALKQNGVSVLIPAGGAPKLFRELAGGETPPNGSEVNAGKGWKAYTGPSDLPEGW